MAKRKKITPKQENFVKAYLNGDDPHTQYNATQSYQKAHPLVVNSTARTEGCKALTNPNIRARIAELLEKNKPTQLKTIISSLKDDLDSTKTFAYRGKLIESRDNANILRTKEMVLKMHGAFKESESSIDNRSINYVVNQVGIKQLSEITDKIKALNDSLGIVDV